MNFLRKLAAILVMILSVIGFVVCAGGVIGIWTVKEPLTQEIVAALDTADQFMGVAESASGAATATVGDVSARLAEIEAAAADMTPEQQAALDAKIESLIAPVERASNTLLALEVGLAGLNDTLKTVSRMPGIRIEPPSDQMAAAGEKMGAVGGRLGDLHAALSEREPDGSKVAAIAGETSSGLAQISDQLAQLNASAGQAKQTAAAIQAQTPRVLTLTSIGLTILLVLFAVGQVSLFVHAWGWFRG